MSGALERFRESVKAFDPVWIDGFDMEAFRELTGPEREEAAALIRKRLQAGDFRAARALADLGDPSSARFLREALSEAEGELRVEITVALAQLTGEGGLESDLLQILETGEASDRFAAAFALRFFPAPGVKEALYEAVEDETNDEVRTAAAVSLMLLSGMMTSGLDLSQGRLLVDLDSTDRGVFRAALDALWMGMEGASGAVVGGVVPGASGRTAEDTTAQPPIPPSPSTPLREGRFCRACGTPVSPGARFCGGCGTPQGEG